jgi:hypothetical protein
VLLAGLGRQAATAFRTFGLLAASGIAGLLLDYPDGPVRTVELLAYVALTLATIRFIRLGLAASGLANANGRSASAPAVSKRGTLSDLSDTERDLVAGFVRALVRRDRDVLEAAGAYDGGADPYISVDHYFGDGTGVDLIVPPGDPKDWYGSVMRSPDRPGWAYVVVDMYDEQHRDHGSSGEDDLRVELELFPDADGRLKVAMLNLHAL